METISMKGDIWTNSVAGNRLVEAIVNFGTTGLTQILERGIGITATTQVRTTTAETITGSDSITTDSGITATKRPDLTQSTEAEIRLQNAIHKEVDSYANIVERGSTTPT